MGKDITGKCKICKMPCLPLLTKKYMSFTFGVISMLTALGPISYCLSLDAKQEKIEKEAFLLLWALTNLNSSSLNSLLAKHLSHGMSSVSQGSPLPFPKWQPECRWALLPPNCPSQLGFLKWENSVISKWDETSIKRTFYRLLHTQYVLFLTLRY